MKKLFLSIIILSALSAKAQVQIKNMSTAPQLRDSTLLLVSHGGTLYKARADSLVNFVARSLCITCKMAYTDTNIVVDTPHKRDSAIAANASGFAPTVAYFNVADTSYTIADLSLNPLTIVISDSSSTSNQDTIHLNTDNVPIGKTVHILNYAPGQYLDAGGGNYINIAGGSSAQVQLLSANNCWILQKISNTIWRRFAVQF